jgi:acetoin utilization deacetylase AcuC-like enzyme
VVIFHDPRAVGYARAGHVERPQRIARSVELLKKRHPEWEWRVPQAPSEELLLRAHSPEHLRSIAAAAEDFDSDCPAYENTFDHAARATGAAVEVARAAMRRELAFSLMRPPGHHATRDRPMGFCYFNHIAVAALDALATGAERVAIWDFDAHHGNGTEAILAHNDRAVFASIHQSPLWPGTGERSFANIHNFPVPPRYPRAKHLEVIRRALDDFVECGKWLREVDLPAGAILEGGYSDDLPQLIDAFLSSWAGS